MGPVQVYPERDHSLAELTEDEAAAQAYELCGGHNRMTYDRVGPVSRTTFSRASGILSTRLSFQQDKRQGKKKAQRRIRPLRWTFGRGGRI